MTPDPDRATVAGDRERGHRQPGQGPIGAAPGREMLVQEGLDHLQRAARETIAAMRTLLDLAEEFVDDPVAAEALVVTIGSFAESAIRSGAGMTRGRRSATARPPDDDDDGRVQRIPVS